MTDRTMQNLKTGMNTTVSDWDMVSELLDGKTLPVTIIEALAALCEGRAKVVCFQEKADDQA